MIARFLRWFDHNLSVDDGGWSHIVASTLGTLLLVTIVFGTLWGTLRIAETTFQARLEIQPTTISAAREERCVCR